VARASRGDGRPTLATPSAASVASPFPSLGRLLMDFIERWFGISPDGGDGSTELLCIYASAVVLAVLLRGRPIAAYLRRKHKRERESRASFGSRVRC